MKGRPGGRFGLDSYELFDWPHLHRTHSGVLLSDHRGAAAERQERRHCCGFRRHGEPDSIWSPWCRHSTLEGHHVVGRALHGDLDYTFDFCCPPHIHSDGFGFRTVRSKAGHYQFAARDSGAEALIARLTARARQIDFYSSR